MKHLVLPQPAHLSKGLDISVKTVTAPNRAHSRNCFIGLFTKVARFDGESDFTKVHFELSRDQNFYRGFWVQAFAMGQLSNDRLLSSEKFSIGGSQFGRGYDFLEITGETGVAFSIEPRYWWNMNSDWLSGISVYGFYDWVSCGTTPSIPEKRWIARHRRAAASGYSSRINSKPTSRSQFF